MHENSETPITNPPSAGDYKALIDLFNAAMRDLDACVIDFPTFQQCIAEIDQKTRALDMLGKLHRTAQALIAREAKKIQP